MAVSRYYSSTAAETTLTAPITGGDTSMIVAGTTGLPIQYPYTLSLDADEAAKELVTVTGAAGTTLTITRGVDGTSAQSHSLGAVVRHDHSARDFRESREHEDATVAHGATGAVVGTTNTQTITNKDLSSGTNTFPGSFATDAELASAIATEVTNRNTAIGVETAARVAADSAAAAVNATLTGAQTLTNKNLTSGTNTFPSSLATLTGVQTVTNKDLTSGTNTFPSALATDAEVTAAIAADRAVNGTWVSFAPTMSSGWDTPTNFFYKLHGHGLVTVRGIFLRDGATITASPTGNITDEPILTVPVAVRPTLSSGGATERPSVTLQRTPALDYVWPFFGYIDDGGLLTLAAGLPGTTISNNDQIYVYATYGI